MDINITNNVVKMYKVVKHYLEMDSDLTKNIVVDDKGGLVNTAFTIKGQTFDLVGVESKGKLALDSLDTWKCRENGKFYRWIRKDLKNRLSKLNN